MKSIMISKPGGPEVFRIVSSRVPEIKADEVLVNVRASGINRPDIFQRRGNYPAPEGVPKDVPGLEISGIVEHCGANVTRWSVNDEVCALVAGGGYAQYVAVNEAHCLPKPSNLSFIEAASLPETIFTVWHNVFQRGHFGSNENLLVHGGSGGIGTTAIQLGAHFGHEVYTTAGSDDKCNRCLDLGATIAVSYHNENFEEVLKHKEIHLILDSIGGDYFGKNMDLLVPDGRLVIINAIKGAKVSLNLLQLMRRRISISGSTLRGRSTAFKAALAHEVEKNVWPLIKAGTFKPIIDRSYSYEEVVEAHRYMEEGSHFGKVILTW